jgi:predicted  nucleic acid-binding Zn-ribbon protein
VSFDDLLAVQDHDTAVDRLRHRRDTLPERAALASAQERIGSVDAAFTEAASRRDDVRRRQRALEDEVATIDGKIKQAQEKLYSGSVRAPRELQALEADVRALRRHKSEVEDRLLEAMEELEPLEAEAARLETEWTRLAGEAGELEEAIAGQTGVIDAELTAEQARRDEVAARVEPGVIRLYEQLRAKNGGVGVARLVHGACDGCHLRLPATELDRIKHQPPEAVIRCDQCGRILVRV